METGARFTSPVRYGDEVRIETTVSEVREKTFRVEHEIVFETSVRKLGECGGHFWAPAYEELEELDGSPHGSPRRPRP